MCWFSLRELPCPYHDAPYYNARVDEWQACRRANIVLEAERIVAQVQTPRRQS